MAYLQIVLLGGFAGLLIGSFGIGGVIVVPILVYLLGVGIHDALAAAMLAFLVSGAIGTAEYARRQSISWQSARWLWLGAAPAALVGGIAAARISEELVETAVGLLAVAAGTYALLAHRSQGQASSKDPTIVALVASGLVTGALSSVTGTGGPLVLVPILIALSVPAHKALGLAQAIQIPVAALALIGYAVTGTVQLALGSMLALGVAAGTLVGARVAHRIVQRRMRVALALISVLVGSAMLVHLAIARMQT